jgi:hypothetical protein
VKEEGYVLLPKYRATDEDSGDNGCIDYELNGKDASLFRTEVQGDCGPVSIVLGQKIDADELDLDSAGKLPTMQLELVAKDRGVPQRSSTTMIFVDLLDENDNRPTFDLSKYSFEFDETAAEGAIIGLVTAEDNDLTRAFSDIEFDFKKELTSGANSPPNPFRLEPRADMKSANIVLTRKVDFENEKDNKKWNFVITARNPASKDADVSEAQVKIELLDINEHLPTIEFKKGKTLRTAANKVYAVVQDQVNVTVAKLDVNDKDASTSAEDITLNILPGPWSPFFQLQLTRSGKYLLNYSGYHADGLVLVGIVARDNFNADPKNETIRFPVYINKSGKKNATEIAAIVDQNADESDLFGGNMMYAYAGVAAVILVLVILLIVCCCK